MKETRSLVKKKIRISNALRRQLIEEFDTTSKTIYQAINYLGNSELLVNIRRSAIEKGASLWIWVTRWCATIVVALTLTSIRLPVMLAYIIRMARSAAPITR